MLKVLHLGHQSPYFSAYCSLIADINKISDEIQNIAICSDWKPIPSFVFQSQDCNTVDSEILTSTSFYDIFAVDLIVVHGIFHQYQLTPFFIEKKEIKVAWFSWGGDLYSLLKDSNKHQLLAHILNRSSFVSIDSPEYNLVTQLTRCPPNIHLHYPSPALNHIYSSDRCYISEQKFRVMLGHVGSPDLGHIHFLEQLIDCGADIHKYFFVIPASYNVEPTYVNELEVFLKANKIDHKILREFIPQERYISIIKTCRAFINLSKEPMAVGTMVAFAYLDVQIYAYLSHKLVIGNNAVDMPHPGVFQLDSYGYKTLPIEIIFRDKEIIIEPVGNPHATRVEILKQHHHSGLVGSHFAALLHMLHT